MSNKNIRDLHVGKNPQERDEYHKLLDEDYVFDRTIDEPLNTDKTNSSTYQEDKKLDIEKVKKKSWFLKIRDGDIFKNIYVSGILIGLAILALWAFFTYAIESGIQKAKITNLENNNNEIENNYNQLQQRLGSLDKNFSVFKEGASKEIEYIKYILKL